jgi:hypothetical protein
MISCLLATAPGDILVLCTDRNGLLSNKDLGYTAHYIVISRVPGCFPISRPLVGGPEIMIVRSKVKKIYKKSFITNMTDEDLSKTFVTTIKRLSV